MTFLRGVIHISFLLGFVFHSSNVFAGSDKLKIIPIGIVSNFSDISDGIDNPYEDHFRNGVYLALEHVNPKLKAMGIQIKLKEFDIGSNSLKVLEVANQVVQSDIVVTIGYAQSELALLAAPVYYQHKVPMITVSASANRLASFDSFIHMLSFNNDSLARAMVYLAGKKFKATKALIVTVMDCAYCQDLSKSFAKHFEQRGHKIVKEISVLSGALDYHEQLQANQTVDFDMIVVPNREVDSSYIIKSFLDVGIHKPFVGGDSWGMVTRMDKILNGYSFQSVSVTHWHHHYQKKQSLQFVRDYKEKYKDTPLSLASLGYDSILFLVQGLQKTKQYDRQGLESALAQLKHFDGVTGHIQYQKDAVVKTMVVIQNQGRGFQYMGSIEPDKIALP